MPTYRITILDANWEEVKEKIEQNLREQQKVNEKMRNSKFLKPFLKLYKATFGIDFDILMSWEWNGNVLTHTVTATAPLKDDVYDNAEKRLKDWGNIKIEKLDENGNVVEVL